MPLTIILLLRLLYLELGLAKMEGFIVGGHEASIQDYPYSAFLSITCVGKDHDKKPWICGASIIHRSVLLTAAHCLHGCRKNSEIIAAVGNKNRSKGYHDVITRFLVHKEYDPVHMQNDIALTRLEKPLVLNNKVKLVVLPKTRPKSRVAYVAGWGLFDENLKLSSSVIKYTEQRVLLKRDCLHLLRKIPDGSICAGTKHSHDYAAEGDSGCALVIHNRTDKNHHTQIGIVSFKMPNLSRSVIVYTDIPYFYQWIQSKMKKLLKMKPRS